MNQISTILAEAGIDPTATYTVQVGRKTMTVTPLGHNVDSMVSSMDFALLKGITDVNGIVDYIETQPKVYDRRINAPNRLSNLGTKTLIRSLGCHVNWYCGAASGTGEKKRTFVTQFEKFFGPQHLATAKKLEKALSDWAKDFWKPEARKYIQALDHACLVIPKKEETKELPPPPEEISLTPEQLAGHTETKMVDDIEVVTLTCKATKKDGTPCKGKPLANGFCSFHQKLALAENA